MNIDRAQSVGELAAHLPEAIPVLERFGVDYSCRGNRSLQEASESVGLDVQELIDHVRSAAANRESDDARDWFEVPLTELIEHIVEDHHRLESEEIRQIGRKLVQVKDAYRETNPEIRRIHALFTGMADVLVRHMFHEERELFGRIERMEAASGSGDGWPMSVRSLILIEYVEHESMAERIRKIREITSNYTPPANAGEDMCEVYAQLSSLEQRLHRHIHMENNVLFPRALILENTLKTASRPS